MGHPTLTTPPHPHCIVSAGFSHVPQCRSGAFMKQHFEALVLPDGMRAVPVFIGTFLASSTPAWGIATRPIRMWEVLKRILHGIAWLSFLCASILLPGAAWPMDASCASAPQQLDDWETASPEDVGLDAAVLCKITQELAAQGGTPARPDRRNVHAVLVVRHGKLVFEAYAAGQDENWGEPLGVVPHDAATNHDVMSISKSVVSLLFGIALERKLIAGTDVPVMSFFPEYAELKTPKWDKILLRHLLTMTPGYNWNEDTAWMDPYNTTRAMSEAADPYRYILEREVIHEPDAEWQYNSGATALLGAVLKKA